MQRERCADETWGTVCINVPEEKHRLAGKVNETDRAEE